MNMVKSLLLGTAAGFVALSAQAADLPGKAAVAPAQYVKVCGTYGAGFFYIPGTDTCLKVGGYVRAQYTFGSGTTTNNPGFNYWGGNSDGDGQYGGSYARGAIRLDARSNTEYGTLRSYISFLGNSTGAHSLEYAYIQFGGLTAGLADSFFNFYAGDYSYIATAWTKNDFTVMQLAYTANFGGGVSGTLALEVPTRSKLIDSDVGTYKYAGYQIPDIVANVKVDQAWGAFQVMGVLHEARVYNTATLAVLNKTGWAVGAGLKLNLDSWAKGDTFRLQGVYSQGAVGRASGANFLSYNTPLDIADGYVTNTGSLYLTKAWSVAGGIEHFWSPALKTSLYAGYGSVQVLDARLSGWHVGSRTQYEIVKDLTMGLDLQYHKTNNVNNVKVDGGFQGVFRIQRNF